MSTSFALAIADSAEDSRLDSERRRADVASDRTDDRDELPLIKRDRDCEVSDVLELSLLRMICDREDIKELDDKDDAPVCERAVANAAETCEATDADRDPT